MDNEEIREPEKKKKKKKSVLIPVLIIIFAGVAVFSGYKLFNILHTYKVGRDTYSNIEKNVIIPDTSDKSGISDDSDPKEVQHFRNVDFEALKGITDNAVGWIYCPGTHVDYPLVQGPDNQYYLRRAVDGSEFLYGSIYLDYRSSRDFTDLNTVIYGHQSNDGAMFEDIRKYKDQSFFDKHPFFYLTLEDGNYILEVFSAYVTPSVSSAYRMNFESDDEYRIWLNDITSKSDVKTGVRPDTQDRIVTLSTCTYEYDNARYVVHGRLVKVETE